MEFRVTPVDRATRGPRGGCAVRLLRACLLGLALMLAARPPAHALAPGTPLNAYHRDTFDNLANAPGDVTYMAQTPDGWLWVGTSFGLYRFDGVKFYPFEPLPGEHLLGKFIGRLAARPNGELWIGYLYGGLSVLRDGHVRHIASVPGAPLGSIPAIVFDGDDVWVVSTTGLWRYRDGVLAQVDAAHGFPGRDPRYVLRDQYGRLWVTDGQHVYRLDRASGRFEPVMDVSGRAEIVESPDGRVWVQDNHTVRPLPPPPGGWRPLRQPTARMSANQSLFDRDGNYWPTNCPVAPCVRRPATIPAGPEGFADKVGTERFDEAEHIDHLNAWSMLEDREGNFWLGTVHGLVRLRDSRLVTVRLPPEMARRTLAVDGDGVLWIGPNGQGTQGRLWRRREDGTFEQATREPKHLLATGRDGTILVGSDGAIERRRGARLLARYPLPDEVRGEVGKLQVLLLAEDRGGIWAYLSYHGMYYLRAGTWEPPAAHPWVNKAVFVTVDDAGRAWFGTRDNHVVVVDGDTWRSYGAQDGLDIGAVTYIDTRHGPLASGGGGTRLWQDGRFRPLAAEHADLANLAGLDATPDGDRWLNTASGLLHVRAADWRRSMDDPARPLRGEILDGVDGFPGRAQPKSVTSTVRLAPDGRIWVAGTDGVAWVNPAPARGAAPPPRVEVTALHANGSSYPGGAAGTLPPGTERLSIDYTALALTAPERVRFRYRLAGADSAWQDAGTARTAYYTNLAPGDYRFEVAALDADGRPGPAVATPAFAIRPTIVQSRWFAGLCAAGAGLCAAGAGLVAYLRYLRRLAGIRQVLQERMEAQWIARVTERARIARTLHDTFLQNLQNLQSLILRLDMLSGRLASGSSERAQLDSLLAAARAVGEEGRSQVLDLRIAADGDLATMLANDADALRTDDGTDLAVRQLGRPRPLDPDVRLEVHSIAREAVSNAFRHARAQRIEVVLDWRGAALALSVTDDGIGMSADLLAHGRPGHWGLTGMRERAARIGAALDLRQRPGGGTAVVLDLAPRAAAGARGPGRRRGWMPAWVGRRTGSPH